MAWRSGSPVSADSFAPISAGRYFRIHLPGAGLRCAFADVQWSAREAASSGKVIERRQGPTFDMMGETTIAAHTP